MSKTEYFNGVTVVIDDEMDDKTASINNLITQIKKRNMPCVQYSMLPDDDVINHLHNISFLILDWQLIKDPDLRKSVLEGTTTLTSLIKEDIANDNIEFLKKLKEHCFCPIFIFTHEDISEVKDKLSTEGLYKNDGLDHIFVKSKSELTGKTKLFKRIEKWIEKTPSIYVLKAWEKEYEKAKNNLFHEFYKMSPHWPAILWKSFSKDSSKDSPNMSLELGEVITRNMYTRMAPFSFEDSILNKRIKTIPKDELRRVLEGERFIQSNQLHNDEICTGDLFTGEDYTDNDGVTQVRYILNIRAQCDLVRKKNPTLYCLKGRLIDEKKINKKNGFPFSEGQFIEKVSHAIVGCIDNGKIIEFQFHELKQLKWNKLKKKRIGRLLPPYINDIQQRYALFLHRQGLPRTPDEAIK